MAETERGLKERIESEAARFGALSKDDKLSTAQQVLAAKLATRAREIGAEFDRELASLKRDGQDHQARKSSIDGEMIMNLVFLLGKALLYTVGSAIAAAFLTIPFSLFGKSDLVLTLWGLSCIAAFGIAIVAWLRILKEKEAKEDQRIDGTRDNMLAGMRQLVAKMGERLTDLDTKYQGWAASQKELQDILAGASVLATRSVTEAARQCGRATDHLKEADRELAEHALVAFWDQIEKAGDCLAAAADAISETQRIGKGYDEALARYEGSSEVAVFSVSESSIKAVQEAALSASTRLQRLSYEAQRDASFANIYEMRRSTRTMVRGFSSLQDAIEGLGQKLSGAIYSLEFAVTEGFRSTSRALNEINSSVEYLADQLERSNQEFNATSQEIQQLRATADRSFSEMSKYARFSKSSMIEALKSDHEIKTMLRGIETGKPSSGFVHSSKGMTDLYGTIFDPGPKIPS